MSIYVPLATLRAARVLDLGVIGRTILSNKIKNLCQLYGYCEIEPASERINWATSDSKLSAAYLLLTNENFKTVFINDKLDIWPAFQVFFG